MDAAAEGSGGRLPGGKPLMALILLCLSLGGALVGYRVALGPGALSNVLSNPTESTPDTASATEAEGDETTTPPGTFEDQVSVMPFLEIIVNITATTATGRTTSRFMKLNVAVVFDPAAEGAEKIEARKLFIRDSFQDYLRLLTERDLRGSRGFVIIKQELLRRVRTVTESDAAQEILISDLVIQ